MLITLGSIDAGDSYELKPGRTRYQLADGVEVTMKEPTIKLVEEANKVGAEPTRINLEICRVICNNWPEDDSSVSMRLVSRIVQDFFLMLTGTSRRPEESSN